MDDSSGTERAHDLPRPREWAERPRPRRESVATVDVDGRPALLLPARQVGTAAVVVLLVVGLLLAAAAVFLVWTGVRDGEWLNLVGAVALGAVGVVFVLAGIASARGVRSAPPGFLLTPDELTVTWVRPPVRLDWDDVTEIRALSLRLGGRPDSPSRDYLGVATRAPVDVGPRVRAMAARFGRDLACVVPMGQAGVDPLVVLHALRFYLAHPDARAELGTPAAQRRIGGG